MGKVLGGGSSINVMAWARGHQRDWDFFAAEAGDPAWSYASVLQLYRCLEDWHGAPDPQYRGTGGTVFVQHAPDPNPIAPALLEGARSVGIPIFENQNGRMMEGNGGAAISDVRIREGKRQSVFRSYTFPFMDRPNLTVLTHALVTRLTFQGKRATGVEVVYDGQTQRIGAGLEVVLALGAIQTPKVLLQSGIGDRAALQRLGIPAVQHLPGVGQNFQDHVAVDCVWEDREALPPRNSMGEAVFFWTSAPGSRVRTPKMGRDPVSVVDGQLRVYGIDHLRVADGSILPRVTTGNTMAPCVIIGERAAEILRSEHQL